MKWLLIKYHKILCNNFYLCKQQLMFSQHSMFRLRADKLQRHVTLSQDTNISKNLAAFMHRVNRNTV